LLGRPADEDGMRYYVGRLRDGYGKAKVIIQLAESAEARSYEPNLVGLQELIAAEKRKDHWLLGFFSRRSRIERQIHTLEFELGNIAQLEDNSTVSISLLERTMELQANRLEDHIARIALSQADSTNRLVLLEQAVELQTNRMGNLIDRIVQTQADSTTHLVRLEQVIEHQANRMENHSERIAQSQTDSIIHLADLEQAVSDILVYLNDKTVEPLSGIIQPVSLQFEEISSRDIIKSLYSAILKREPNEDEYMFYPNAFNFHTLTDIVFGILTSEEARTASSANNGRRLVNDTTGNPANVLLNTARERAIYSDLKSKISTRMVI